MIHKSSVINSNAKISKNVKIGPFCKIGDRSSLGCFIVSYDFLIPGKYSPRGHIWLIIQIGAFKCKRHANFDPEGHTYYSIQFKQIVSSTNVYA